MAACNERWNELLSAALDGELDSSERRSLARHLRGCAPCRSTQEAYGALRERFIPEKSVTVPDAIAARIQSIATPKRRSARMPLLAAVTAAAVAAAATFVSLPAGLSEALADDLERHHLQAFSRATPCEFESSNPEEVEGWLERELGQNVEVPRIEGATLLGARRCKLAGERVGAVLYRHGEHALTVFVAPAESEPARLASRFADDGPRCTSGRVGERICIAPGQSRTVLAVAAQESTALAALTASVP